MHDNTDVEPGFDDRDDAFRAHVEQYDDRPDECTIFPETPSQDLPRTTAWLTAQEGSFVPLQDAR
jgi:hypothetical protein